MARGYEISNNTKNKQFLKEAGALIELVNLIDNYRLGRTKFNNHSSNYKRKAHKEVQRIRREKVQNNPRRRHVASKSHIQKIRVNKHTKPVTVSYKIKSQSSRALLKQFNKISRSELRTKKHENAKLNTEVDKPHRSISSPESVIKAFSQTGDASEITKCLLSNLAMNNGGMNLLKDLARLIECGDAGNTPTIQRSKNSKASLKSSKNYDPSNLREESRNHTTKKQDTKKKSFNEYSKFAVKKSSFNLNLNFNLKSSCDVINLRIKTTNKTHSSHTDEPHAGDRLFDLYDSTARQEQINKLLVKHLLTKLSSEYKEDFPNKTSVESSKDYERHFLYQPSKLSKTVIIPHTMTHAVYNVYEVQSPLEYRNVHGIKSNLHLHMNFNNLPRNAQPINTEEASTVTKSSKPYKIRFKSGVSLSSGSRQTSLQQSFSVGTPRSDYDSANSETCDCEPPESSFVTDSEPLESSLCETCCHAEEMERLNQQYTPRPRSFSENFSNLLRRTKERITYRVTQVRSDPALLVSEPCNFLKRMYRKCTDQVEQEHKNAGICTCSHFIETERVSVIEKDLGPECSVLKRLFGNLIFNDKCVVCAGRKVALKHHKRRYECEPGTCIESKPLFGCLTKLCAKCKPKKKIEKKKKKKTPLCNLVSLICNYCEPKKKKKKEDKRRLLSKCCKFKKHGDTSKGESTAKKGLKTGRRHFRYCTKRIRDRYYRNKKLAQQQKDLVVDRVELR